MRLDYFPTKDLIGQYRNVFGGMEGPKVLAHMLYELGLFEDIPNMTPEDAALKNYASRLLQIIGGDEVKQRAIEEFIGQLTIQPLKTE